ncbi:MAG: serine/threonine protein kinase [Cyanobacteria bacterium SZAS LIN-3]|nr:serine/threonine protein kinase [Cyanobacteria bacterium SZAS LIN-3]
MNSDNIDYLAQSRTFTLAPGGLKDAGEDSAPKQAMPPGTIVDGKYKIISLLGTGGMGAVYKATHLELNKEVALKTFASTQVSMDAWLRFQREAQAIAKLDDANIIKVFDFGIGQNNLPYYTMELLAGHSLADRLLLERPLPKEQALHYFRAVAQAMLHAHRLKMVHRDIKPANIFICQAVGNAPETIKLVDFGITKLITDKAMELDSQRLTGTGLIFGSPLYMSPEQSLGQTVDERSDIYSFGCSLYEALTGQPPFVGTNAFSTMLMHQQNKAPALSEKYPKGRFEQRLESFVARSLAKAPAARHQSFEEVLQDLQMICESTQAQSGQAPHAVPNKFNSPAAVGNAVDTREITVEVTSGSTDSIPNRFNFKWLVLPLGLILLGAASVSLFAILTPKNAAPSSASQVTFLPSLPRESEDLAARKGHKAFSPSSPYFRGKDKRGHRIFEFPAKMNLGELYLIGEPKSSSQIAMGRITFPPGAALYLDTGPEVAANYRLLAGFGPDDLASIGCDHGYAWTARHFKEVGKLTHLKGIKVVASALDADSFTELTKLNQLDQLMLADCPIRAEDVLKIKRLPLLRSLCLDGTGDMTRVVDAIKNSKTIEDLSLANCQLTDRDLEKIATIKHLVHLKVGQNNITTAGLKYLLNLPDLNNLDLEGAVLGPDCIPTLKAMKLNWLKVNAISWPADKQALLRSFPNCRVRICGNSQHEILEPSR